MVVSHRPLMTHVHATMSVVIMISTCCMPCVRMMLAAHVCVILLVDIHALI